ncbi:membrane protein [Tersicoccus solisilvae]|uniref:Membrane protein n=1 Tax=Tersicoccus solisilvae TaxID=1882339 RepID=A0ABQ1PKT0_9MICC|nr:trimeric intracellular cation channel family protein [Tersicoccus solisilvae]GGC98869.1 membrane protein [Tersicoccus solisilvae]
MSPDATVDQVVRFVDLAGVLANAVLGGIAARTARLDVVGFVVLAILSGLGGGMIRDALLQAGPVVALTDPLYLVMALIGAGIAFIIPFRGRMPRLVLALLDALSLGCWANVGAQKTLDLGLTVIPALLMGALTAVGGSTVRDVMLNKKPAIFGGNTLSATSALLSSAITVGFYAVNSQWLGSIAAIVSATALSLLARRFDWGLPTEVHPARRAKQASTWLRGWWSGIGNRGRTGDHEQDRQDAPHRPSTVDDPKEQST